MNLQPLNDTEMQRLIWETLVQESIRRQHPSSIDFSKAMGTTVHEILKQAGLPETQQCVDEFSTDFNTHFSTHSDVIVHKGHLEEPLWADLAIPAIFTDPLRLHTGPVCYTRADKNKQHSEPTYEMEDGILRIVSATYYGYLHDTPIMLQYTLQKDREKGSHWSIGVFAPNNLVLKTLMQLIHARTETYILECARGKVVDHQLREISLKHYRREELVHPPELLKRMELLCRNFTEWQRGNTQVKRWGVLGIGRPGTGKTTTGGLIAGMKMPHVTVMYLPAKAIARIDRRDISIETIKNAFRFSRLLAPCIIILDDADLIMYARENYRDEAMTAVILDEFDGLTQDEQIFLMAFSNRPEVFDDAIRYRPGRVSTVIQYDVSYEELAYPLCKAHLVALGSSQQSAEHHAQKLAEWYKIKANGVSMMTPDLAANIARRLILTVGMNAIEVAATDDVYAVVIEESVVSFLPHTTPKSS